MKRNPEYKIALKQLNKAFGILFEACHDSWLMIDDDFLRQQYGMGFPDYAALVAKVLKGPGVLTSSERDLLSDLRKLSRTEHSK